MSALSSEINNLSELSDFESDVIKFQSEITEVRTDLEDLMLRVRTLPGTQSNLPGSFTEDLVSMMRQVDSLIKTNNLHLNWVKNFRLFRDIEYLDIIPANTYTVTSLQQIDSGLGEVEDIPPQEEDEIPQAMLRSGQEKELEEKETISGP